MSLPWTFALAQVGHTYINVIDIEAGDLRDLPVREPSEEEEKEEDVPARQAEDPSPAALHLLAASVTVTAAAPLPGGQSPGSLHCEPCAHLLLPGSHRIADVDIVLRNDVRIGLSSFASL